MLKSSIHEILVYGIANLCGLATSCINPVLYGYLNESFRKEYKNLLRKLPWYQAEPTVSRNESRRNGIELPQIRRHSRSLNDHKNHPPASKSLQNISKMGIKSRSCATINIESRDYNMSSEVETRNNNEHSMYTNHLLVPPNNFVSSQHDCRNTSPGISSSRSSSFPNEDSTYQILHKDNDYKSVIINIPNIQWPQKNSNANLVTPHCIMQDCSKLEEAKNSTGSLDQTLLISNVDHKNIMADHHDLTISKENQHNHASFHCAEMPLEKNINTTKTDNEQCNVPSCSNSNCSASWCSLCSFSSKFDAECCSLCNCNLSISKNEIPLMRSLSLPINGAVIDDTQSHVLTFIERTSSCKVTKAELSDNEKLDFYTMN